MENLQGENITLIAKVEISKAKKHNLVPFHMCGTSLQQYFFHIKELVIETVQELHSIVARLKVIIENSEKKRT